MDQSIENNTVAYTKKKKYTCMLPVNLRLSNYAFMESAYVIK